MMDRCYRTNTKSYKYYGAKGVTVDERWHKFWNFVEDVDNHLENGHLLYQQGYHLDKDFKGGMIYSLENCVVMSAEENRKMATLAHQRKILAYNDVEEIEFESITIAGKQLDMLAATVHACLKRGGRNRKTGYYFKYID